MNPCRCLQLVRTVCCLVVASCPWNESAKIDVITTHSQSLIQMQQTFESDYVHISNVGHSFFAATNGMSCFQDCCRRLFCLELCRVPNPNVFMSCTGIVFTLFLPFLYPFSTLSLPCLHPFFTLFLPCLYPFCTLFFLLSSPILLMFSPPPLLEFRERDNRKVR